MTDDKVRPGRDCRVCGEDRASRMVRSRSKPDGLATICLACQRARRAEYRAANPNYNRDYYAANRDRHRATVRDRVVRLSARTDSKIAEDRAVAHPDNTKRCRGGHTAPVDDFYADRSRLDGLQDYCRPCHNARSAEYRNGARLDYWAAAGIPLRCLFCHGAYEHADHLYPLALGGADELWALRPSCGACNLAKSDRPPLAWLASRPVLPYSDALAAASIALAMIGELDEDVPAVWSPTWVEAARLP